MSASPEQSPRPVTPIATGVAPPHSIDAEQSVLGGILLSDKAMYGLRFEEGLRAEHFYRDRHRTIYAAMCELADAGAAIDVLTVTEQLRSTGKLDEAGGKAGVDELCGGVPGLGGIRRYGQIVIEHFIGRERIASAYEQLAAILNHHGEDAYQAALQRAHTVVAHGSDGGFLGPDALANHVLEWLNQEDPEDELPVPSELPSLAEMVQLLPGQVTVLGAWPHSGKTSMAIRLAAAAGRAGHRSVICSNEDVRKVLAAKHIANETGIPTSVILRRKLDDSRMPRVVRELGQLPFEVQPAAEWAAEDVAMFMRRERAAVVVLDHFHNLRSIGTVAEVDESLRVLAAAALQTDTHLVICAQLNRNRMSGVCKPPPVLADLRGSGMFEAAAHTILLVHRDEEETEDAAGRKTGKPDKLDTGSVDVAKNKQTGKTGVVRVLFDAQRIRFVERAYDRDEQTAPPATEAMPF